MSDTWENIQALKKKQESLRERMQRRKRERERIGVGLSAAGPGGVAEDTAAPISSQIGSTSRSDSPAPTNSEDPITKIDPTVEYKLLEVLCNHSLCLPTDSPSLQNKLTKLLNTEVSQGPIESLLQKFSAQELIDQLTAVFDQINEKDKGKSISKKRKRESNSPSRDVQSVKIVNRQISTDDAVDSIESLLAMPSIREQANKKMGEEIFDLLSKPTAKEQSVVEKFKSQGKLLKEFCPHGTKGECMKTMNAASPCDKLHFRRIINKHTDESLGDCSFLNTCFHMDTCKYVHYEIDFPSQSVNPHPQSTERKNVTEDNKVILYPPQWIQCDMRSLDTSVLGKFSVVMADPPWDIHMELPYGTMQDDEMRQLNVPGLQDDGFIFLWVTGSGVKLQQSFGKFLDINKSFSIVGIKGEPKNYNCGLDCDVLVAEVRETSHKPDEIYGLIERLSPGTRKIELFGRPHNVQPNWITLGNQLDGVHLLDPEVVERFKKKYPDGNCMKSNKS
ncbi:N(6)-adenosine-methyltransferase subunit METTL3-like [Saccoglossus kowalevskii]